MLYLNCAQEGDITEGMLTYSATVCSGPGLAVKGEAWCGTSLVRILHCNKVYTYNTTTGPMMYFIESTIRVLQRRQVLISE